MGSTIESAMCFSLVLLLLTVFIVYPVDTWKKCIGIAMDNYEELTFHIENSEAVSSKNIDGYESTDTCPELVNTAISGIIDSVNIIKR